SGLGSGRSPGAGIQADRASSLGARLGPEGPAAADGLLGADERRNFLDLATIHAASAGRKKQRTGLGLRVSDGGGDWVVDHEVLMGSDHAGLDPFPGNEKSRR